jgi:hypothetical protein
MKIGFYKPFIKVYFNDDRNDFNATSYEVTNVMNIFEKFGHEVKILSNNDLNVGDNRIGSLKEDYDRIILYGGPFKLMNDDAGIIDTLRNNTSRLDFLLTDMRCMYPKEKEELIDNFYSQSTNKKLFGVKNKYGGVAEIRCFNVAFQPFKKVSEKDIKIYFGGTTRNRLKKYLEYVWRPNVLITGKSEELKFNNRVTRDVYFNYLERTKYSVVFADVDYEENNFITPRFYEYVQNNIVGFCDKDWDKGEKIMKSDDWRRVSSYLEWMEKIEELEKDKDRYFELLVDQQLEIKPDFISGKYVYNCLK